MQPDNQIANAPNLVAIAAGHSRKGVTCVTPLTLETEPKLLNTGKLDHSSAPLGGLAGAVIQGDIRAASERVRRTNVCK
jgi:hypothetical protein